MISIKEPTSLTRKSYPNKKIYRDERRIPERKDFSCYMRVFDNGTQALVGHLVDICSGGFKLDSQNPIPINKDFRLFLNLTSEVADQPYLVFIARSKWCQVDPLDPFVYNTGFQLINISPGGFEIFNRMIERYGTNKEKLRSIDLRRSNKW